MSPVGRPLSQHKNQRHIGTGLHVEDDSHVGVRHAETGQRFCVFLQRDYIICDGWGICTRHEDLRGKKPSERVLFQSRGCIPLTICDQMDQITSIILFRFFSFISVTPSLSTRLQTVPEMLSLDGWGFVENVAI